MSNNNTHNESEFDQYDNNYKDLVNEALSFSGTDVTYYTKAKAHWFVHFLKKNYPDLKKLRVLDVGCGIGQIHPFLKGEFKELVGVDVSSKCLEKAKEANPENTYFLGDGNKLPFEDNEFDVALTICTMHHVPPENWEKFVQEIHRILKPQGALCVFEHNPYNPLTVKVVNNCVFDKDAVLLSTRKLKKIMQNSQYQSVGGPYIIFFPWENKVLQSIEKVLTKVPFGAQYLMAGFKPQSK